MLREWKEPVRPGDEELKMRLAAAREKLAAQQLLIKEQKVPVLVLLEGWGTAGKGYCMPRWMLSAEVPQSLSLLR